MRLQTSYWLLLAAGGLLLPATAAADDPSTEGVVRLGKANASLPSATETTVRQAPLTDTESPIAASDAVAGASISSRPSVKPTTRPRSLTMPVNMPKRLAQGSRR